MADPKLVLIKLTQNLNTLCEREAKYGGLAPLELVNQIDDHQKAIALTEQMVQGELSQAEWQEAMKPLLVAIDARSGEAASSVTIGDIQGGIYGSEIAGHDINIGQKINNFFFGSNEQRDQRNRQTMLKLVKDFWVKGVLENSLHNAVMLELGMVEKKEAVVYPWEMVLQAPHQPNCTLALGTKIIDIFDQHQTLLILGEPGAGKTTMLLELARQTISRAEADLTQPIPVVFNLSSWAERRPPLAEWLVMELNTKYSIPKKVAQPWIDSDALLLLLDGLDEVAQAHRAACVEEINLFRKSSLIPVVVCSRIADYDGLSAKLNLAQAIVLQPFTTEQVYEYLARFGSEFLGLKLALQRDPNLMELAKSPLLLSVMTLAYQGDSAEKLPLLTSIEVQRHRLFEVYVQRLFERRNANLSYSREQTLQWLAWLAQEMSLHSQTMFLIERMQPSWLQTNKQKWMYVTGYWLFAGLIGGLLVGLSFELIYGLLLLLEEVDLRTIALTGLIVCIRFGLLGLLSGVIGISIEHRIKEINIIETLRWSWNTARNKWKFTLYITEGTIISLSLLGYAMNQKAWWIFTLIATLGSGLFFLGTGLSNVAIETTVVPNQGIRQSAKYAVIIGLIAGLGFGAIFGLPLAVAFGMSYTSNYGRWLGLLFGLLVLLVFGGVIGSISGVISGFWYGGLSVIQHYTVRFILYLNNYLPWNLTRFLDYAADRIFLRKVGGGYIFIHRYLMEYFASLEPEQAEKIVANQEQIGYGNH